jgi:5'-methylthioadenosine phosphorylase
MKKIGVRWLLSVSAVGSMKERIRPGDIVVPDQFYDHTKFRPNTFFGDGVVGHVQFSDPVCPALAEVAHRAAKKVVKRVHRGGTYLCMEGPAFSTRAESNLYRSWGCSVIGMTNHSEARLAREAEIAYATLAMVTDYDCWHEDHASVTVDLVIQNLQANAALAKQIVAVAAERIDAQRPGSSSHSALRHALMTPREQVPADTRRRLDLFTAPYWGPFEAADAASAAAESA